MKDELIGVPINRGPADTRFENKVGFLNRVAAGESLVKKRILERLFIDLVAGESLVRTKAAARFSNLVGSTNVAAGGETLLPPRRFRQNQAWVELNKIWRTNSKIKGFIFGRVRGGFSVYISGFLAFLPSRRLLLREGKSNKRFTIESINSKRMNIVVSACSNSGGGLKSWDSTTRSTLTQTSPFLTTTKVACPIMKSTLTQIPLLTTTASPRDGAAEWARRLEEENKVLKAYMSMNKTNNNDWFRISAANPEGTRWTGKCWYVHNLRKYEFDLQFDIPLTYPATAPEIEVPELNAKPHKIDRGKICLTVDFKPLWAQNCPRYGIAHALCLVLSPWLAAELPILVDSGMIKHKFDADS